MFDEFVVQTENQTVMEDAAWRFYFGKNIEVEQRKIISLYGSVRMHRGEVTRTDLTAVVMIDFRISKPTAEKIIDRTEDLGLIASAKDEANETRTLYSVSFDVASKVTKIAAVKPKILAVTLAQMQNPADLEAGKDLLDIPIYFNCRSEAARAGFTSQLDKTLTAIKASRGKKEKRYEMA